MENRELQDIRRRASERNGGLSEEDRQFAHEALLYGSEACRNTAAEILFHAGNETSVPYLAVLVERERSERVRQTMELALRRIIPRGWIELPDGSRHVTAWVERFVLCASDDIAVARQLLRWCRENDKRLGFAEPNSSGFVCIPCVAMVVDPDFVGRDNWESYCDFCEQVAQPYSPEEKEQWRRETGSEPKPQVEDTPVVLMERESEGERARIPPSKESFVWRVGPVRAERVVRAMDQAAEARR